MLEPTPEQVDTSRAANAGCLMEVETRASASLQRGSADVAVGSSPDRSTKPHSRLSATVERGLPQERTSPAAEDGGSRTSPAVRCLHDGTQPVLSRYDVRGALAEHVADGRLQAIPLIDREPNWRTAKLECRNSGLTSDKGEQSSRWQHRSRDCWNRHLFLDHL